MNDGVPAGRAVTSQHLLIKRLIIGVAQGLWLCSLRKFGHFLHPQIFFPLTLVGLFIPFLLIVGQGHLHWRQLWRWSLLLAIVVMLLGWHAVWREGDTVGTVSPISFETSLHMAMAVIAISVLVFISDVLIIAGVVARRRWAPYQFYADWGWKLVLQFSLSSLLVIIFLAIFWLGVSLFELLQLDFLRRLGHQAWFMSPVCTTIFALSVHVTDVNPALLRSIRTLLLTLFSWLLPVLVILAGGFLISLPMTGLASLWQSPSATMLLFSMVVWTVVLINAVLKEGSGASISVPRVLRLSTRLACFMLLPLIGLAAYALKLRIDQYGLTPDRIFVIAALFIAAWYGLGYTWAALGRQHWLQRIASTNVLTAFVILAVLLSLLTPLADPARLSVVGQVKRLVSGRVAPNAFDYQFLRFQSAIYGRQALTQLLTLPDNIPNAEEIRNHAAMALALQSYQYEHEQPYDQDEQEPQYDQEAD